MLAASISLRVEAIPSHNTSYHYPLAGFGHVSTMPTPKSEAFKAVEPKVSLIECNPYCETTVVGMTAF